MSTIGDGTDLNLILKKENNEINIREPRERIYSKTTEKSLMPDLIMARKP